MFFGSKYILGTIPCKDEIILSGSKSITSYLKSELHNIIKIFRFYIIALCAFSLVSSGIPKQQSNIIIPEQQSQASHDLGSIHAISGYGSYGEEFGGHISSDDGAHHNGAELTSLAHSSAVRANNAVQNQQSAGSQAAFGAASNLASTALGAAQTAQAALVGKQAIVQNLRKQLAEAEHLLQGEIAQYQQSEGAAQIAQQAAQQSQIQVNTLAGVLSAAQGGAQHSEQASAAATKIAASQHSMVAEAKERVARVLSQIQNVLEDLRETEISAQRAAASAQIAQANAAAAGVTVATAGTSINGIHSENHHY